jgi:thiol-disulfide isomerase/thioredoxin
MILPTLQQWAEELEEKVEIVKFNCNKHNKELGIAVSRLPAPLPVPSMRANSLRAARTATPLPASF